MSRSDSTLGLDTVGGACALLAVLGFVVGVALMVSAGVDTLIPETGAEGRQWIADVEDGGGVFLAGAWVTTFAGLFLVVAYLGFYDALREAGPALVVAPVAGAVGMALVTVSHLVPVAMAYELAPGYVEATGSAQSALAVTADTLASVSAVVNTAGNALGWGVAVPLYALAILRTRALPRWIGWLGMLVAVLAGWLGLLGPVSEVVAGVSSIGFAAFFVFVASMGVAVLRRRDRAAGLAPAATA